MPTITMGRTGEMAKPNAFVVEQIAPLACFRLLIHMLLLLLRRRETVHMATIGPLNIHGSMAP